MYVCTNLGAWHRPSLNEATRAFIQKFYRFKPEIEQMSAKALPTPDYEVLSVRCGDSFYSDPNSRVQGNVEAIIFGSLLFRVERDFPYCGHGQALAFCIGLLGRWVSLPAIRNAMAMK